MYNVKLLPGNQRYLVPSLPPGPTRVMAEVDKSNKRDVTMTEGEEPEESQAFKRRPAVKREPKTEDFSAMD